MKDRVVLSIHQLEVSMKSFSKDECAELKNIMRKFSRECAQNHENIEAVKAEIKNVDKEIDEKLARLRGLIKGQPLKKVDLVVACKAIANFKR